MTETGRGCHGAQRAHKWIGVASQLPADTELGRHFLPTFWPGALHSDVEHSAGVLAGPGVSSSN